MDSKRQLTAIKNRNWSSKTQRENAKYVRAKLEMLGYNVPTYMKKGRINQEQIDFYVKRITNKLENIIEKDKKSKMSKGELRRYNSEKRLEENKKKLDNYIKKHNKQVKEVYKYIDENYSDWQADYLKGLATDTPIKSDKYHTRDNSPQYINEMLGDLNNNLKIMKSKIKESKLSNFKLSLNEANKNADADFEQFLNEAWIINSDGFPEDRLQSMKDMWRKLNVPEKEMMIRGVFEELREIYKDMNVEDYQDPVTTAYNNFMWNFNKIGELRGLS